MAILRGDRSGQKKDLLTGKASADSLFGMAMNDTLHGGRGGDELWGDAGNDIINGGTGWDVLAGGSGNDKLTGGEGLDEIYGGDGYDVMSGGMGGSDIFVFKTIAEIGVGIGTGVNAVRDGITDFHRGADFIDHSAIDANIYTAGNQDFTIVSTFSGLQSASAGELTISVLSKSVAIVSGDENGDGATDFNLEVRFDSGMAPSKYDFFCDLSRRRCLELERDLRLNWIAKAIPSQTIKL